MRPRTFTLDEASSLLPRLSELLLQTQECKLRHDQHQDQIAEYTRRMSSNGDILERDLNETRQEMGCELKDIDQGLIDFRAEREGREVYLCWKLGEPDIRWWHDLESGFAGRQPLE